MHIDRDKCGNYVFIDRDLYLKYCSAATQKIKVIDSLDMVWETLPSLKFNQLRDRFLVRVTDNMLKEYSVSRNVISLVKEIVDKNCIDDFCYFHKNPLKMEGAEIVLITEKGVLKRTNVSTGVERRFVISSGRME